MAERVPWWRDPHQLPPGFAERQRSLLPAWEVKALWAVLVLGAVLVVVGLVAGWTFLVIGGALVPVLQWVRLTPAQRHQVVKAGRRRRPTG
jgi:hypothetical protein